jgi:hypothetical protein
VAKCLKAKEQPSGFPAKVEPAIDWLDRQLYAVENLFSKTSTGLIRLWRRSQYNQHKSSKEKPAEFLWNANPYLDVLNEQLNSQQNWFNKLEAEFVGRSVLQKRRNVSWRLRFLISVILGLSGLALGLLFI